MNNPLTDAQAGKAKTVIAPETVVPEAAQDKVDYSVSGGLLALLAKQNVSIAFTSYQSGLLYMVGRTAQGGINIHQTAMPKPMGLCLEASGGLCVTTGYQIMRLENVLEAGQAVNGIFDACYVPRTVHVTGRLDAHDVGIDTEGRVIFVNTRFNCLATTSQRHSFEVVWTPPFISGVVDEDRCHLNGLAMEDGRPRYVTAVSRSDTIDGWRDRRRDGGVVIDVETNEIVCAGLSMPHSPRMHNGELWLLNSGTGELGKVVFEKANGKSKAKTAGRFEPVVFCPGFLRGLRIVGNLAFVGLSKPRYKRFEGLALDQKLKDADTDPWCGIQVIDLSKKTCVEWFRLDGSIGELYDVELLPDVSLPMAVPPVSEEAANLITYEGLVATPAEPRSAALNAEAKTNSDTYTPDAQDTLAASKT
jgi:uncharacterized protein (TIGR03032 family)